MSFERPVAFEGLRILQNFFEAGHAGTWAPDVLEDMRFSGTAGALKTLVRLSECGTNTFDFEIEVGGVRNRAGNWDEVVAAVGDRFDFIDTSSLRTSESGLSEDKEGAE